MADATLKNFSAEAQLALAHTPLKVREALRIFLELDSRLARIVAGTSEPMLGQMRLAWWRETLALEADKRPGGDAVLDAIGEIWRGEEPTLITLVDGWEAMLAEELDAEAVHGFADGRSAPFPAIARMAGEGEGFARSAGRRWAMIDAAVHVGAGTERDLLIEVARSEANRNPRLPRSLRGLAVLDALARRSLARGGRPLMEGRGAALTALRAAIIGR